MIKALHRLNLRHTIYVVFHLPGMHEALLVRLRGCMEFIWNRRIK